MDAFFQPPPPARKPAKPPRYRRPPWFGAPPGALAGVVAQELVLAHTEQIAVCSGELPNAPS